MIRRVDHTAVVVADMDEAVERWVGMTGAVMGLRTHVPVQGVEIAMLHLGDTTIELICPDQPESGVGRYLEKHGESLHHIGIEVAGIEQVMADMRAGGMRLIDEVPRPGADALVAFIHPKSTGGVLMELIERPPGNDPAR